MNEYWYEKKSKLYSGTPEGEHDLDYCTVHNKLPPPIFILASSLLLSRPDIPVVCWLVFTSNSLNPSKLSTIPNLIGVVEHKAHDQFLILHFFIYVTYSLCVCLIFDGVFGSFYFFKVNKPIDLS